MMYKGYTGVMEVDEEAGVIHGRVVGLRDTITFEGETPAEAMQAFRDSVDDYLEFCTDLGQLPEKPVSGRFNLRLGTELHRALACKAEAQRISLNEAACRAIAKDVGLSITQVTLGSVPERPARKLSTKGAGKGEVVGSKVGEGKIVRKASRPRRTRTSK